MVQPVRQEADRKSGRVGKVTGVQTCALPISSGLTTMMLALMKSPWTRLQTWALHRTHGRASRRGISAPSGTGRWTTWPETACSVPCFATTASHGSAGTSRSRSEERSCRESDWSSDVCSSDLLWFDDDDVGADEEPLDEAPDVGAPPDARSSVEAWHIRSVGHRPMDYMARDCLFGSLFRDHRVPWFSRYVKKQIGRAVV